MANNRINKYIGAIAVGAALVAVPGCTDSWDDHYNGNGSVTETSDKTLWEVISSREDLSKFAEIVRQAKYYKDNTHPVSTYSYADILAGGQVNTVWAPDNDALSGPEGEKWIKMLTDLTNGDVSVADGYSLQQQPHRSLASQHLGNENRHRQDDQWQEPYVPQGHAESFARGDFHRQG